MDPAWVGFAGGVIGTTTSTVIALRQRRDSEHLARLGNELDLARHEREALIDRKLNAEDILARYREPLAAAAFDLQSRCYNILALNFFQTFDTGHERFHAAQTSTLFRFAQYFGWTEILRRNIQFLNFPEAEDTRRVAALQSAVAHRLASSKGGEPLMIWTDEQRAIGERMIVEEHGEVICMGYARFGDEFDQHFKPLCRRVLSELSDPASTTRLREVQHLLCDLVETLDTQRVRYSRELKRA
jgi:hypothetical protein